MSGIVFFKTEDLSGLKAFYKKRIGAEVWKDQGRCIIFDKKGFKFSFCEAEGEPETCGVLTFLYESREAVDEIYGHLEDIAISEPVSRKPEFDIYQFYGEDPEGRTLEFQCFLDQEDAGGS
ncbi:VOC family protein [Candidatus Bipolaricaulota bacterium]|nr:VOC family protein [Candidatus Bipolaricaulota bacterium]